MEKTITATFEDGVLKPSEPLNLREHTQVRLTVVPVASDDEVAQKLEALTAMWKNTRPHSIHLTRDQLHERR